MLLRLFYVRYNEPRVGFHHKRYHVLLFPVTQGVLLEDTSLCPMVG